MTDWTTGELRGIAKSILYLGKQNTAYGPGEIATYGLAAEALEYAADALEAKDAEIERLREALNGWYEDRFLDEGILANPRRDDAADVKLCELVEKLRLQEVLNES